MGSETLLRIEPLELRFNLELGQQSRCTIRLSNITRQRVAFKVMTTNPEKYCVRPNVGIISPKSSLDVDVTMHATFETLIRNQCKDKFLIKSLVANSADSTETARRMFNETWRPILQCKLKVVYNIPSDRPPPTPNERVHSPTETPISQAHVSQVKNEQQRNDNGGLKLLMKIVAIGFLFLASSYLIVKILPFIWSLTIMLSMLAVKMIKKQVSDSAEDWVVKALLNAAVLFFPALYGRLWNNNNGGDR